MKESVLIDLQQNWLDNVVADELKATIAEVPLQIFFPPGEEIVHNDNAVSSLHQAVNKMTSDETGTSCHNNSQGFPLQAEGNFTTRAGNHRVLLLNDGEGGSFKIDPVRIHHCVGLALFSRGEHTFGLQHKVARGNSHAKKDEHEALLLQKARVEQEEIDTQTKFERQRLEDEHRKRLEQLLHHYRQLQDDYAELDEIERCWFKRARVAACSIGAAVATQQSVQRRLWVKNRSQAWWERCNDPRFPELEFHRAFRMSRPTFELICEDLGSIVAKEDTMLRAAIPVKQRVAVCIWRLATGEPLRLVSKRFGLGISTCHKLILEVCAAINDVLLPKYVQWPSEDRVHEVMEDFESISGIPNVVGSMYTTHIPIIAPKINVGAYFNKRHTDRNQKTSYSITLQGVVDIRGSFTDVCIGWPGSMSDYRVLENSALYQKGGSGSLQGSWVVGGIGYPLLDWLLVPYSHNDLSWAQHTVNERLMEIQKIGKGAFSRLKGRWKFLQRRTEVKLQELPAVLGACCVLHNVCEQHGEGFDPDLNYEVVDDDMYPEAAPMSLTAMESRDSIAQQLMHGMHMVAEFI